MEEGFGNLGSSDEEDAADSEEDDDADEQVEGAEPVALTEAFLEWVLGVALGRFDVRLATCDRTPPPDPNPFDALPVCSPGMLQGKSAEAVIRCRTSRMTLPQGQRRTPLSRLYWRNRRHLTCPRAVV
jgi:hypothetical protein